MTSIMATCPLLLGLMSAERRYDIALQSLFPVGTDKQEIVSLLCPKVLTSMMKKVSVTGESRRGASKSTNSASEPSGTDNADHE